MSVKSIGAGLGLFTVCLGFFTAGNAQEKVQALEHPYYPLDVGNKWIYRAGDQKVVVRVDKLAALDFKKGAKAEKIAAARLVITKDDRELNEYVAVLADGIYRFVGDDKETAAPVCFLKFNAGVGDSWDVKLGSLEPPVKGTFTAGDAEVIVPAGTYKCKTTSSSDFQIGAQKMSVKYWFAYQVLTGEKDAAAWQPARVGIVKQEVKYGTYSVTLELEKFLPAAPK